MTQKEIYDLYKLIIELESGTRYVKFDLHIHTPASQKDFKASNILNTEDKYLSILDDAIINNIEIISITDHNTFKDYNKIKELLGNKNTKKKYEKLLVLCGIEITCYSKHLLAIFPDDFSIERQKRFLEDIGIPDELQGTEDAMADIMGPSILLQKIYEYGGVSILAHADTQKGFLYSFCRNSGESNSELNFTGKSLSKIIQSPYLYGIQICNSQNKSKIQKAFQNVDYVRDKELPLLFFSDSHGNIENGHYLGKSGKAIGVAFSIAKFSYISFSALKMALLDSKVRIVDEISKFDYPQIIGGAIKSNVIGDDQKEFCTFKFNSEMNCIIGARGTGKSTLLRIIQNIIFINSKEKDEEILQRFEEAVIYIQISNKEYAIYIKPVSTRNKYTDEVETSLDIKIYIKKNSKFVTLKNEDIAGIKYFLTSGYKQRQLYLYSKKPEMILEIINDFLRWQKSNEYENLNSQINYWQEKLNAYLKEIENERKQQQMPFIEYLDLNNSASKNIIKAHGFILQFVNQLNDLRFGMIDELNKILNGKVKLALTFNFEIPDYNDLIKSLPRLVSRDQSKYYDYEVEISKFINRILEFTKYRRNFDFFNLLLENKIKEIITEYNLSDIKNGENYLVAIRACIESEHLQTFLQEGIKLEYNVNSNIKSQPPLFRDNTKLSLGQNAVALLLLVLNVSHDLGDSRPLLMDQPEDDLDNSYIYETLVEEFRKSKGKRQIIISTHNANIPVAADAENIMVLKHNGKYGYIDSVGSIDNPNTAKSVLEILEGGKQAIKSRIEKYQNSI